MKNNVLFHTFVSEGYLPYVSGHIDSLTSNTEAVYAVTSLNCEKEKLESFGYSDRRIFAYHIDEGFLQDICKMTKFEMQKYTSAEALKNLEKGSVRFKLLMSVYFRYRDLIRMFDYAEAIGMTWLVHTDVDARWQADLASTLCGEPSLKPIQIIQRGCRWRPTRQPLGAVIVLKITKESRKFLTNWIASINAKPFAEWPRGFGQITLGKAVRKTRIWDISDPSVTGLFTYSKTPNPYADLILTSHS